MTSFDLTDPGFEQHLAISGEYLTASEQTDTVVVDLEEQPGFVQRQAIQGD